MRHCDPDVLALAALGETPSDDDSAHLAQCPVCQHDVAELVVAVAPLKVEVPPGPPIEPPPAVWQRIAAQTGVSSVPRSPQVVDDVPRALDDVLPLHGPRPAKPAAGPGPAQSPRPAGRLGRGMLLAVAASALAIGALTGSLVTYGVTRPDPATVVAQVRLSALPLDPGADGQARIVRTSTGERNLVVDVSRLEARPGTFYEVWLIDPKIKKMVGIGILTGSEGEFTIPASIDVGEFPIVDISVQEPGDPRHSGNSVLRGTLPA